MAEVRVRRAGRDDQVVVRHRSRSVTTMRRDGIDRADVGQQHLDVRLMPQNPADRRRDVAGRQRRRRHLIEQRLEDVMVVTVEQRDANRRPGERARRVESAESAADDDDMRGASVPGSGCSCSRSSCAYHRSLMADCPPRAKRTLPSRSSADPPPSSTRRARSTARMPAAWPSPCSAARSSTSTARTSNPVTDGFICAKVRKFDQLVYGPDRLLYPAVRKGRKGEGKFKRVSWDEALELVAEKMRAAKASHGGASILPYSYGGSNGLLTQDNIDAQLWRRFGTSRLARTVCAAPTGAANMALYGKMASVTLPGLPRGQADHPVGRQSVGVRHPSRAVRSRGAVARREARRRSIPGSTPLARSADVHLAVKPGHRRRRRARDSSLSVHERLRRRGVPARAHARRRPAARARRAVDVRAGRGGRGRRRRGPRAGRAALRGKLAGAHPLRLGLERNRNGGNAAMAVLSLPAVGGKFGVRGGGYSMSNSASWNIERPWIARRRAGHAPRQHESSGPRADRLRRSAGQRAVRLQLQSGRHRPRPAPHRPRDCSARICSRSSSSR